MTLHGQHSHWPKTPSTELSVYTEPGHQRERERQQCHTGAYFICHTPSQTRHSLARNMHNEFRSPASREAKQFQLEI